MSKVITLSRAFLPYHPKAGQETFFAEKVLLSLKEQGIYSPQAKDYSLEFGKTLMNFDRLKPKCHTVRSGHRFKTGDMASLRVWGVNVNPKSGRSGPYHSRQEILCPDVEVKVWDFTFCRGYFCLDGKVYHGELESDHELLETIANNDGLEINDFKDWFFKSLTFKKTNSFDGQIIAWSKDLKY